MTYLTVCKISSVNFYCLQDCRTYNAVLSSCLFSSMISYTKMKHSVEIAVFISNFTSIWVIYYRDSRWYKFIHDFSLKSVGRSPIMAHCCQWLWSNSDSWHMWFHSWKVYNSSNLFIGLHFFVTFLMPTHRSAATLPPTLLTLQSLFFTGSSL